MKLSDNGLKFIKRFEAYMKELPDGSCTAYQEVLGKKNGEPILDIPTIGWGCTAGVKMGMVWSREKAEDALRVEIAEHEAIVNRVVTTELTQGQFDALVSFNYNCGKLPSARPTSRKKGSISYRDIFSPSSFCRRPRKPRAPKRGFTKVMSAAASILMKSCAPSPTAPIALSRCSTASCRNAPGSMTARR